MPVVLSERKAHSAVDELESGCGKMGSSVVKSELVPPSVEETPPEQEEAAAITTESSTSDAVQVNKKATAAVRPVHAPVVAKMADRCCNPFRIPRHVVTNNLRNVPKTVRENLTHVSFGHKVCTGCRLRVYQTLKHRKRVSSSPRLVNNSSASKRQRRLSEVMNTRRSICTVITSPSGTAVPTINNNNNNNDNDASAGVAPAAVKANNRRLSLLNKSAPAANGNSIKVEAPSPSPSSSGESKDSGLSSSIESALEQMTPSEDASTSCSDVTPPNTRSNSAPNLTDAANSIGLPIATMSRPRRSHLQQQQQQVQPTAKQVVDASAVKWVCCFCGLGEDDELQFGKFYEHKGIVTHYYCLLLSSNMEQKGSDEEGILGFLADDIQKEIRRGKRLVCSHCKKSGATLGCCNAKCKRIFHFPCGLKSGSLHQYFGEFRSYCINHRPKQKIDERVKKEVEKNQNVLCYICYEDVVPSDSNTTLWAPCCKKNAWFHRKCVQKLAMSAGYFFKCPLCNNKREFQTAMLEYGIFIPRQDASWELVPNAYEELLYRHDRCDANACLCPKGRKYTSSNPKWELVLCRMCGSQGTHVYCGKLKSQNSVWDCHECLSIIKNPVRNNATPENSNSNSTTRSSEISIRNPAISVIKESEDDSDSDISVGNESPPITTGIGELPAAFANVKLRPGPMSFKLQQMKKLNLEEDSTESTDYSSNSENVKISVVPPKISNDVICIDSDDDAVEIVCESVMKSGARNNQMFLPNSRIQASSSNFNVTNVIPIANIKVSPSKMNQFSSTSTEMPMDDEPFVSESNDSPFNIVISNVTSVPAEFFASVPESNSEMDNEVTSEQSLPVVATGIKRTLPLDEELDCEIVSEAPKRARIDDGANLNHVQIANIAGGTVIARTASSLDAELSNVKQSSSKVPGAPTMLGSNGASSSESCHGDAGNGSAILDTARHYNHAYNGRRGSVETATLAAVNVVSKHEPASYNTSSGSGTSGTSNFIHTIFKNGPSSPHNGGSSGRGSFEFRKSTRHRTGLIPDRVCLSDLKFKVYGDDVELSIGVLKYQMKINRIVNSASNGVSSDVSVSVSPFAGSNQNMSSSKSLHMRSDDSEESCKNLISLGARTSKNFVYEDDNTLLEYPISMSVSQTNSRSVSRKSVAREKKLNAKELKENWDPEVSSSSAHTLDSANNNQTNSADFKESSSNVHEKSNKTDEKDVKPLKKEKSNSKQRLVRRSNRITRYFQSVQKSNVNQSETSEDLADSNLDYSSSIEKSNHTTIGDQSVESSLLSNVLNKSEIEEQNEHLKNVEINDLSLTCISKINGTLDKNEIDANEDIKVRIDLKKLENLLSAKPDLFLKTSNNGVRKLCFYKDEKLRVELESGEEKFLNKSQSFDCLLNFVKDDVFHLKRSKSLNDLLQLDFDVPMLLTDEKDCSSKNNRRSLRQQMKEAKEEECVS